jgi:hypothetical protein
MNILVQPSSSSPTRKSDGSVVARPHSGPLPQERGNRSQRFGEAGATACRTAFSTNDEGAAMAPKANELSSTGRKLSLSPGERAGVRASLPLPNRWIRSRGHLITDDCSLITPPQTSSPLLPPLARRSFRAKAAVPAPQNPICPALNKSNRATDRERKKTTRQISAAPESGHAQPEEGARERHEEDGNPQ